jgi:hypothetical protein
VNTLNKTNYEKIINSDVWQPQYIAKQFVEMKIGISSSKKDKTQTHTQPKVKVNTFTTKKQTTQTKSRPIQQKIQHNNRKPFNIKTQTNFRDGLERANIYGKLQHQQPQY